MIFARTLLAFFCFTVERSVAVFQDDRLKSFVFPLAHLNITNGEYQVLREQAHYFEEMARKELNSADAASKVSACGQSNFRNPDRIVGGMEAKKNEFPWQAWLIMAQEGAAYGACGGSLINNQWILTAAHCVDLTYRPSEIFVYLGGHYSNSSSVDSNRQMYKSTIYFAHPQWDANFLTADIALVKLPTPIPFNDYIRPICIPSTTDSDHVGDVAIASGWGKFSDSIASVSPFLRKVNLTVISKQDCSDTYGDLITDHILCTNGSVAIGVCSGDSGGPLGVEDDGIYTIIGVTSFASSRGCEAGDPSGFTRVRSFVRWINDVAVTSSADHIGAIGYLSLLCVVVFVNIFV